MLAKGQHKRTRKNPNDLARFINQIAIADEGEVANKNVYTLDEDKIAGEAKYDGLYALCTDLPDDETADIICVDEGRWQIEACFRNLKTDFYARPVSVKKNQSIKAHFLTCFLALIIFKILKKKTEKQYTDSEILETLKSMNFSDIEEQRFIPLYGRTLITGKLHEACGFRTDMKFITKQKREISKN